MPHQLYYRTGYDCEWRQFELLTRCGLRRPLNLIEKSIRFRQHIYRGRILPDVIDLPLFFHGRAHTQPWLPVGARWKMSNQQNVISTQTKLVDFSGVAVISKCLFEMLFDNDDGDHLGAEMVSV